MQLRNFSNFEYYYGIPEVGEGGVQSQFYYATMHIFANDAKLAYVEFPRYKMTEPDRCRDRCDGLWAIRRSKNGRLFRGYAEAKTTKSVSSSNKSATVALAQSIVYLYDHMTYGCERSVNHNIDFLLFYDETQCHYYLIDEIKDYLPRCFKAIQDWRKTHHCSACRLYKECAEFKTSVLNLMALCPYHGKKYADKNFNLKYIYSDLLNKLEEYGNINQRIA